MPNSNSKSDTVLSSAKEGALAILLWAKEASVVFPPLQAAAGIVLSIAETVDVSL